MTRHRAIYLAAVLVAAILLVASVGRSSDAVAASGLILLCAGSIAAVACSRLLCPGAALTAARWACAPWWIVPVGRLMGAWLVIGAVTLLIAAVLTLAHGNLVASLPLAVTIVVYVSALGSFVMSLAPFIGSSGAAASGLVTVWMGTTPPSVVMNALSDWPALLRPVLWAWNLLPMAWRAGEDLGFLFAWVLLGVAVTSAAIVRVPPGHPRVRNVA